MMSEPSTMRYMLSTGLQVLDADVANDVRSGVEIFDHVMLKKPRRVLREECFTSGARCML